MRYFQLFLTCIFAICQLNLVAYAQSNIDMQEHNLKDEISSGSAINDIQLKFAGNDEDIKPFLARDCVIYGGGHIGYIFDESYYDIKVHDDVNIVNAVRFSGGGECLLDDKGDAYIFYLTHSYDEESDTVGDIDGYQFDKEYEDYNVKKFIIHDWNYSGNDSSRERILTTDGELRGFGYHGNNIWETGLKDFDLDFDLKIKNDGSLYYGDKQIGENITFKKVDGGLALSEAGVLYKAAEWGSGEVTFEPVLYDVKDFCYDYYDGMSWVRRNYIVLKNDGTVWMKGSNDCGQLGVGSFEEIHDEYVQVSNLTNVVSVSLIQNYNGGTAYALNDNGDLWYWGSSRNTLIPKVVKNIYSTEDEVTKGDVNGDGAVTTKDAVLALQMSTGKRESNLIADVNKDGSVTTKDAVLILRYSTGKIVNF